MDRLRPVPMLDELRPVRVSDALSWKVPHHLRDYEKVSVPLELLNTREAGYKPDEDKVLELKRAIKAGKKLPYIQVTTRSKAKTGIGIEDGHHRTQALKELGYKRVDALIHPFDTDRLPKGVR